MRVKSSVLSISWIPSEAIQGVLKLPFSVGMAHYDEPPPDTIDNIVALRQADRFRFANVLEAWLEVDDSGAITDYGQLGGGQIGATTMRLGNAGMTVQAVPFPDLRPEPEVGDGWVRFRQTAGGRTGFPMPRRVRRKPFIQISAPSAWTSLALTLHADGTSEFEVTGASPFPRHWIYDENRNLAAKTGTIDFKNWALDAFGEASPWGDQDSPALVTAVETALERQLSTSIMSGKKPKIRKVAEGELLVEQGAEGNEMFLVLDGVLSVEVNGEALAEVGPGSVLGERALLEGGRRTSTLRAVTPCKVAVAAGDDIDREALAELSTAHRREESN
jgi:Cyclic nucleotide-binding domain